MTTTHPESLQSGIAALNDTADPFTEPGPYPVSGLAMPEGVVTRGGSGETRLWPAETLREAADKLEGKSIVADFHPASPEQAPAGNIVGKILEAGYEDGVGLRFSGEVTDREIAKKIDRNYLEVSTRPGIAQERYDTNRDLYVVEEIADFLDLGLVDWGAAGGNNIDLGSAPAVAALARSALGTEYDWQPRTEDDDSHSHSDSNSEANAATTTDDPDPDLGIGVDALQTWNRLIDVLQEHDEETRLDVWAAFLSDLSGSVAEDTNFDVVHRLLAAEIEGATSEDVAEALPAESFTEERSADEIREAIVSVIQSDTSDDSDDEQDQEQEDAEDEEDEETESNSQSSALFASAPDMSLDEALEHEFELSGTTPDRCFSIKSGAETVDVDENPVARDVLGIKESITYDLSEDEFARDALGLSDDREPETVDLNEAPVERHLLGLSDEDEDIEETVQRSYDERLRRNESESDGEADDDQEREPEMIDLDEAPVERYLLGLSDEDDEAEEQVRSYGKHLQEALDAAAAEADEDVERISLDESPIDRHLLGLDDKDEEEPSDPAVKSFGKRVRQQLDGIEGDGDGEDAEGEAETEIDLENLPVERHLLGLDNEDDEEESADPVVKSYGERVRKQMDDMDDDDADRIDIREDPVASQALGVESDSDAEADD